MRQQNERRVFDITERSVKLWASEYIPFEPTGWKKELKEELRSALNALKPEPDDGLYASYQARQAHFCDIENVLLYNVGSGVFRHLATSTLCIEGRLGYPYPAAREGFPHFYHYELSPRPAFRYWTPRETVVEWMGGEVSRVEQTPAFFWNYMKRAKPKIASSLPVGEFGIPVRIRTPRQSIHIANMIKPMLDGIICAFHQHDREIDEQVHVVLSNQLAITEHEIKRMLTEEQWNVLGARNLIQAYRNGVKWNPADERCLAIKIEVEYLADCWRVDGRLFSII